VILKAECSRILAHHLHIAPAKARKSLSSYLAKGGREVDKVNAGEELRHINVFGHCFDVPACAATDLRGKFF